MKRKRSGALRWLLLASSLLIAIPLLFPTHLFQLAVSARAKFAVRARMLEFARFEYPIAPDPASTSSTSCFWLAKISKQSLQQTMGFAVTPRSRIWPVFQTIPAEIGSRRVPRESTAFRFVGIPLLPPALLLFAATLLVWWRWWRKREFKPGTCSHCGYDLTGNASGICPECGNPVPTGPNTATSCDRGVAVPQCACWQFPIARWICWGLRNVRSGSQADSLTTADDGTIVA